MLVKLSCSVPVLWHCEWCECSLEYALMKRGVLGKTVGEETGNSLGKEKFFKKNSRRIRHKKIL